MKLILVLLFIFLVSTSFSQSLDLYSLRIYTLSDNQQIGFVSLSDKYLIYEYGDPNEVLPDEPIYNYQIPLNGIYRTRLFAGTNIQETDTMFLFNYKTNTLVKVPVSKLKSFARLNEYADEDFLKCHPESDLYMFGFEINEQDVKSIGLSDGVFIYFGNFNPFKTEKLNPFVWKKIKAKDFPFSKMDTTQKFYSALKELCFHYYKSDYYQYYVVNDLYSEYVLIFDFQGNKINEISFHFTESCPLAVVSENVLSQQYVGSIFKDKPELIMGFEDCSFECSHIIFTNPLFGEIVVK